MNKIIKCILVSLLFLLKFSNSKAQTNCGWQQGDFETHAQANFGDAISEGGLLVEANFNSLYGATNLVIGGTNTLRFTLANAIHTFLPAAGIPAALTGSLTNPLTSSAGELAGQVLALQLNVDFSDAGYITATQSIPFGDLVIHDYTTTPDVNGMTVREFLDIANTILGGGSASFGAGAATTVATLLNNAFLNGTASQFAQEHLKKGWSSGDFETYSQSSWGDASLEGGALLSSPHPTLLSSLFAVEYGGSGLVVGGPFPDFPTVTFTSAANVYSFLPAIGSSNILSGSLTNPITTPAGDLAGQVVALKLNVDFSDEGYIVGTQSVAFGDLVMHDFTAVPSVNGMTVRAFFDLANSILSGGSVALGPSTTASVASILNNAFLNGTPSQFAQEHLRKGWQQGDFETYNQSDYGDGFSEGGLLLASNFSSIYGGGGLTIGTTYTLHFTDAPAAFTFLPATGIPGPLTGSLTNPITSTAGALAGEVFALKLNIDLSDAGHINGIIPLGDLIIHEVPSPVAVNGMTVREFLNVANTLLGGGGAVIDASDAANIANLINDSFLNGTPSQFAKDHLISPCDVTNQCPAAGGISEATAVGTALNIQLQGSDADGNTLTYSISQNPSHGTATTTAEGAATYTPAAGYSGNDQFTYTVSDGQCSTEATVDVIVVICPKKKGDWKNNPASWPTGATPTLLGTVSYTQAQLINILNIRVGNGPKADASLILAHQLIPAKLNIANGTEASAEVLSAITSADAVIGSNTIPMKVKPNTPLGQSMIALATLLEAFNNGSFTEGCQPAPPTTSTKQLNTMAETADVTHRLEVKAFPNPSASDFTLTPQTNSKERMIMQVIDMHGRIIETRNVNANSMMRFGDRYRPGTYFVRIIQGKEHKEIKLIKLSD